MVNGWLVIKNFVFGGNYFARGEFVLYINRSGKYVEINFNPFASIGRKLRFRQICSERHSP